MTRAHVWFGTFVVIVFAAGLAAGVALDRSVWHSRGFGGPGGSRGGDHGPNDRGGSQSRSSGRESSKRSDGPPTGAFVRELDELLKLTPDQEAQVSAIIDASRPQMRALQAEASKKFGDQQQSLRDQIVKTLTPEQVKKLEETPRGPFGFRWRGGGRGGR